MIEIDGSMGEGGGAIIRTALALCAVSKQPIHIFNIRVKRDRPGLQPQHLCGVEALAEITKAKMDGSGLHAKELTFEPKLIEGGKYRVDIGTAGSTTLILQILMPAASFASGAIDVEVSGGTDNPLAPSIDFLKNVKLPTLHRMGYNGKVECLRRGHYPRGGGVIRAQIEPVERLRSINLIYSNNVNKISGVAHAIRLPEKIATKMAHSCSKELIRSGFTEIDIKSESYHPDHDPHMGPGAGITIWAETELGAVIGASSHGRRGKPAEQVGREAADNLIGQLRTGAAVDRHLTDQLIPYMALAEGTSEITSTYLTTHALTNVKLVQQILGVEFQVDGELGKPGRIKVEGLGFKKLKHSII